MGERISLEIKETKIPGCYEILPFVHKDHRGAFVKTYHKDDFIGHNLVTNFDEEYYSVSTKGVLRGLHFQLPPKDHTKIVYCVYGEVLDVVVDLRVGSPTYGESNSVKLSADNAKMIYIPKGLAHGFYALSNQAIVMYKVTTVYSPEHDTGILWNSVGIRWPDEKPIISQRDLSFPKLKDFACPFCYRGPNE